MWEGVYYNTLDKTSEGRGSRILPYSVICKYKDELNKFIQYLDKNGYECVEQLEGQKALLVNTDLKRWCTYPKACAMSCKNHRNYTVGEFCAMNKST